MAKTKVKKQNNVSHDSKKDDAHKSKKEKREEIKSKSSLSKTLKNNLPIIVISIILIVILALVLNQGPDQSTQLSPDPNYEGPVVTMHQFHLSTCQFCIEQSRFNPQFSEAYPYLDIVIHDIQTPQGQELLQQFVDNVTGLDQERIGTPITIVGDNYLIGFGGPESTGVQMANLVEEEYQRLLTQQEES